MVAVKAFIGPALPPQWLEASVKDMPEASSISPALAAELVNFRALDMEFPATQSIAAGLSNLGNTCFLAAALQCLTHLPPLACFSLRRAHVDLCAKHSGEDFCTACALHKRICRSLQLDKLTAPRNILNHLSFFAEHLTPGHQEDAHEFLRCCLDAVERDSLALFKRVNGRPFAAGQEPKTEIAEVFEGKTRSRVTCLNCGAVSDKLDPFYDLSLDLPGCTSVDQALQKFTATERLDGSNLYCCETCKQKVEAEKHVAVHVSPNALVIHLKRFSHSYAKISRPIDFPDELDLGPCMTHDAEEFGRATSHCHATSSNGHAADLGADGPPTCMYHLTGVIVHKGYSARFGHYYAYVRTERGPTAQWWRADDQYVEAVPWSEVADDDAYVLFYTRHKQRPCAASPADSPRCSPTTPLGSTPTPKRSWESNGSLPPSPKRARGDADSSPLNEALSPLAELLMPYGDSPPTSKAASPQPHPDFAAETKSPSERSFNAAAEPAVPSSSGHVLSAQHSSPSLSAGRQTFTVARIQADGAHEPADGSMHAHVPRQQPSSQWHSTAKQASAPSKPLHAALPVKFELKRQQQQQRRASVFANMQAEGGSPLRAHRDAALHSGSASAAQTPQHATGHGSSAFQHSPLQQPSVSLLQPNLVSTSYVRPSGVAGFGSNGRSSHDRGGSTLGFPSKSRGARLCANAQGTAKMTWK